MTHEFTSEQWEPINQTFIIEFPLGDNKKPLVQVYQYHEGAAILVSTVTVVTHIVTISTPTKFPGYIIIL